MKRTVSLLLALVMIAGMMPQSVVATENPCSHTHDDFCYTVKCTHVHGECSYVEGEPEIPCDHDCTQDVACAEKVLACTHVHDESCGYAEAKEDQDSEVTTTSDEEIGSGTPDGTPPIPTSLTLSVTEVTAPSTLDIIIDATDDVSGVASSQITFYCKETDKTLHTHLNYENGKLQGTLIIDQYVQSGTFMLNSLLLYDKAGNHASYSAADLKGISDSLEFSVVANQAPDTTPPVPIGLTLSSTELAAPGTVDIMVEVTDDVSGVASSQVTFYCKETDKTIHTHLKYEDGKLQGTLKIDQYVASGTFTLNSLLLYDKAGNHASYSASDLQNISESLVFSVVASQTPDITPPVPSGLILSTVKVTAPGILGITVEVTDDVSGVASSQVTFSCKATAKTLHTHLSYEDGKLQGTLKIDQYVESGTFVLNSLLLYDKAGNHASFDAKASELSSSTLSFRVFNAIPDITTSVSTSGFVDTVKNSDSNAYIAADYSGDATMPKAAFEAIAGTDKTIDLISEGITWRFEGSDITEEIKDIDLKVDIQKVEDDSSASGDAIENELNGNPGVVMKFPENGTLPGKATIQVKVDYAMRQYLGSNKGLCVYYYNNQTGELELIASNLKVINDTYVEFPITHCSYYVLAPMLNGGSTSGNSGTCGADLTWEFDETTKVLTISGTGAMYDYDILDNPAPWYDYRGQITELSIQSGVTSIGNNAFSAEGMSKCNLKGSLVLPQTLTVIGQNAFTGCGFDGELVLPQGLNSIGDYAFAGCTGFTGELLLPKGLTKIGRSVFVSCFGFTGDLVIPEGVTSIGEWAFMHCSGFDGKLVLPETLMQIDSYAFVGCCGLSGELVIPESITSISQRAFDCCCCLSSVVLPQNLSNIGVQAFIGCDGLKSLMFTDDAPVTIAGDAFEGVTATAYYPAGNSTWTSAVMLNYGGDINWKPYCPAHVFGDWIIEGNKSSRTCTLCGYTEHKVTTDSGDVEIEIPDQPELDVEVNPVLPTEENYILVEEALESTKYDVLKVFDINLKNANGVHIQPNGTVKVKLPLDWEKDGNYKVYRVNADKTLTDMNAYRQGSHMVFETDHFSIYVIAEKIDITAPTAKALTYTGSAQALVNAGSVTGGTIQYSLDGVTYSASVPTATNADTYTVYYKAEDSQTAAQTVSVTIAKAEITITADNKVAAVGTAKPTLTYTVAGLKGSDKLSTNPTLTCNATMSTAGDYEIIVSGGDAGANYEIQRVNGKLSVKKEHKITVASATNGTVSISPEKAIEGTQVTITVTPKSGYKLSTLVVKDAAGNSYTVSTDNNGKYYFIMPAVEVTVTATFTKTSTSIADTSNPKTGDDFNMVLWSGMAMTSLLCMAAMVLGKKKHG